MQQRRNGFTLIELLVVLAVVTIVSSIGFGATRSIADGNNRTTCQSNLAQIYKSVKLYSQDFDGNLPYLNPLKKPTPGDVTAKGNTDYVAEVSAGANPSTPAGGIGLWGLYTFRTEALNSDLICPSNDVNLPLPDDGTAIGLSGYVRSSKIFHCPADRFDKEIQYRDPASPATCTIKTGKVLNADFTYEDNNMPKIRRINPAYLSYQANDDVDVKPQPPSSATPESPMTYSSFRQEDTGNQVRQVNSFIRNGLTIETVERPTPRFTVITWCRFHRKLNNESVTVPGRRNFDNVLFSDGSVQSLPAEQTVRDDLGAEDNCTGWRRVPRERAELLKNPVANCNPSP